MRAIARNTAWTTLVALAAACGGSGGDGAGPADGLTIQKASPSGDQQSNTVQQALANPLRVVVARDGTPEVGTAVTWSDNTPGASFQASTVTDAGGIASTSWTLGRTAGLRTATASVTGGGSTRFTATALPDVAAGVAFLAGAGVSAAINTSVQLQAGVSDQYGNRIPASQVNWSVVSGDATLAAPTTTTNSAGVAAVTLRLGSTIGAVTVQAVVTGVPVAVANLTATAAAAVTDTVRLTVSGGARFSPTSLTVPSGRTVVFKWESGTHDINPFGNLTFRSFTPPVPAPHLESVTLTIPGTYQFFCSVHGSQTGGMRGTIVVQ